MIDNKPFNPTWGEIVVKTIGGLIISVITAIIVFVIYYATWDIFKDALAGLNSVAWWPQTVNPMIAVIMSVIWFIGSFFWTLMMGAIYNFTFSNRYYDFWKMISLSLIVNSFIFIFAVILYLVFYDNIEVLFFILMFHILFSTFVSLLMYDVISNPNYSAEFLIWYSVGFFLVLFLLALMFKFSNINQNPGAIWYFLSLPIVLVYTLLPLIESIWEKIYYKFYEMWNNFLYVPSLEEILVDEEEVEDVNVEVD